MCRDYVTGGYLLIINKSLIPNNPDKTASLLVHICWCREDRELRERLRDTSLQCWHSSDPMCPDRACERSRTVTTSIIFAQHLIFPRAPLKRSSKCYFTRVKTLTVEQPDRHMCSKVMNQNVVTATTLSKPPLRSQ